MNAGDFPMETPRQMCARIVAALEDLAGQEAAALQARDFTAAVTIQDRAAPLLEHLAAHAPELDASLRARLVALQARRNQTGEWLAEQLTRTRESLQQADAARRRIARIAPAYGRGDAARPQLCAVG